MDKLTRTDMSKSKTGSRHRRKLGKYSTKFNRMFEFYLRSYRSGILTFAGVGVDVRFDVEGDDAKMSFREYDNGSFKNKTPYSRHSNILKAVITAKKSWGLWCDQWSDGVVDWTFTEDEILNEFTKRGIDIPEPLLKEFRNLAERKKIKRNNKLSNK